MQVEKTPPPGNAGQTAINSKFIIPTVPEGDFPIDVASYVLDGGGNIDGGDVTSEAFARLLLQFPMFDNIYFNPLLTDDNVFELDMVATFADVGSGGTLSSRVKTGRAPGAPEASGQMPNNTALLAQNESVTPPRPGLLISSAIDISSFVPTGTADFMLYWKLYEFEVTPDVMSDHGALAGTNEPAIRYIKETEQEPTVLEVYLSCDDGASWQQAGLLEPLDVCDAATTFRVAFLNRGATEINLTSFAVLF